jgi:glycosyltransferase involved in cell wall biosynthesis
VSVALVHDYLTQRGGAERVLLSMLKAFPSAPLFTSLYEPSTTFPEFASHDVRPLSLDRLSTLRRNHRLALPLLSAAFSRLRVDADVVLCSSSGWAHGVRTSGRKVVYCYTPARWLYQRAAYVRDAPAATGLALSLLTPALTRWDRRAAWSADRYVTSGSAVRDRIREAYGIEAEVLPPPVVIDLQAERMRPGGVAPGFLLCVSRLLPYKNIDAVMAAFAELRSERLVIVGAGPDEGRLRAAAPRNVRLLGRVGDPELRWLYANCQGVVAASYEDYGLTPLEAAAFGKPAAVLRWGGFTDTVVEGGTGLFFDRPKPRAVRDAIGALLTTAWDAARLREHAARYSEEAFIRRLREVVGDPQSVPRSAAEDELVHGR